MINGKKSEKQIATEKSNRIMQGISYWAAFYRLQLNPQRFVKDYLNVHLKLFQKILIYAMMHNNYVIYLASRGQGECLALYKSGKIGEVYDYFYNRK